ncbi:hypothetical protein [Enterococcus mundtii]|uniref:hypothetical protein n=1 Tax=Enterococcus mundtii TaxID=53346 RepID=UPI001A9628DC|nr:hypothetical protein [Enterococcus mundtii]MBO1087154.1 hypothetical protein [Enterococcus mundtii]
MKTIEGVYRLVKEDGLSNIESSANMDIATKIFFLGMLIEVTANNLKVTQEELLNILLDSNKVSPVIFAKE